MPRLTSRRAKHRVRIIVPPRKLYKCIGGPFSGQSIYLTDDCSNSSATLIFSLRGFRGRYYFSVSSMVYWVEM